MEIIKLQNLHARSRFINIFLEAIRRTAYAMKKITQCLFKCNLESGYT